MPCEVHWCVLSGKAHLPERLPSALDHPKQIFQSPRLVHPSCIGTLCCGTPSSRRPGFQHQTEKTTKRGGEQERIGKEPHVWHTSAGHLIEGHPRLFFCSPDPFELCSPPRIAVAIVHSHTRSKRKFATSTLHDGGVCGF